MYERLPDSLAFWPSFVDDLLQARRPLDIEPGPGGTRMSDSALTIRIYGPLLKATFPGQWTYAALVAIYPGAQIQSHVDAPVIGTRYHIPLQLNDGCWVFHDGTWQQLTVGAVYTMDPTKPHGAVNWGPNLRLHLLLDVLDE